jgi:aldehyde dehydrogenase (NAD+)
MTNNLREAELFLSVTGSDCGIANVNIGTSGAEIGGGEKKDTVADVSLVLMHGKCI